MLITEKDIFLYVFFKESLDKSILKELEHNPEWESAINFYKEIKAIEEGDIVDKKLLADKIPAYKYQEVFYLNKYNPKIKKGNGLYLAAESEALKTNVIETFISDDNNYLIRILFKEGKRLVYIFSNDREEIPDMKIIFEPGDNVYLVSNSLNPFEIEKDLIIERIKIELL